MLRIGEVRASAPHDGGLGPGPVWSGAPAVVYKAV